VFWNQKSKDEDASSHERKSKKQGFAKEVARGVASGLADIGKDAVKQGGKEALSILTLGLYRGRSRRY
jgi:hypothetical protein